MNPTHLHPYSLRLVGGGLRHGALVRCVGPDGATGWGDAAPLPGWSAETMEDVLSLHDVPSLRCAVEAGEVGVGGYENWQIQHARIPVNALLDGSPEAMIERARLAAADGCVCYKIKAAGVPVEVLQRVCDAVCKIAGDGVRLRLDPNRAWDFEQALEIARRLQGYPIEYIEEPLADSGQMGLFLQESPLPVALDETLRGIEPASLPTHTGAAALVLKPTLMGGFRRAREFALAGLELGMVPVVSACFESGVGIYALGRFAASLPVLAAAGLDTLSRLETDVLSPRLRFDRFDFLPQQPMPPIDRHVIAF